MSQNNDKSYLNNLVSTSIGGTPFSDRSIIKSQLGTRSKLTKLGVKQRLYKDEYRPEILPPPPLGKSIGHGLGYNKR